MITSIYLIQLIAFQIWYITSAHVKMIEPLGYARGVLQKRQAYQLIAYGLAMLATTLFVVLLGWTSGIFASMIGFMGIGCFVILLNPFQYISTISAATLYVIFLILELLI